MVVRLPSKKVVFLIIACVIGVSCVGFATYASKNPGKISGIFNTSTNVGKSSSQNNSVQLEMVEKALKVQSEQDDDNDGLLNWEEKLWGTDPSNPDTDKDGTKDGDEPKLGRNPLVAGPNDKVANNTNNVGTGVNAKTDIVLDNSKTAQIGRDLFTSYMQAKQAGAKLDATTEKQIIAQAFSNKAVAVAPKQYRASDVIVSASTDLKKYGNDLGLAFYAGTASNSTTEIEILHDALINEKPKDIVKLDPIIAGYTATLNALASVQVPKDFVTQHIALLNSLSKIIADVKGFRVIFDDPIVGLGGVSTYYADLDAFETAIVQIQTEFVKKNISFEQTEYGYLFTRII